ncbi:MAG TPA: choice-of-anchor J domain-containing protein [Bacteroidales bacterium]
MKKTLLLIIFLFVGLVYSHSQNVWLNEFHYDNVGTDAGEFIEIVLENAGNYTLSDFSVILYNGNNGGTYDTKTLSQFTAGAVSGAFSFYYYNYPENGIQNGAPDGIAITYQGILIPGQFLSYEGTFTATDGPANGITSTDIGVEEIGVDLGLSLQLAGTGSQYSEFVWQDPAAETKGNPNNNQFFGGFTPDPEPTNYPTNFTATADGLSITLTWTDATGEQLPSGYLILGEILPVSRAGFETPVDGVPVPDDLDWSDFETSMNVPYGDQTFTYSSLTAGEIYQFTIYPYTNSGEFIDYKTDGTAPTANATVSNIVVINSEDFENGGLGTWVPYNIVGDQVWTWAEFNGDGYAKMNGYAGQSNANEDWLVSPDMNLLEITSVSFTFISAMNFAGPALQLLASTDYEDGNDPTGSTWTNITDEAIWSSGGYAWTQSGIVDLNEFAGSQSFHLAFKYTSTTDLSSVWEVDNLFVYSQVGVGIVKENIANLNIYPNPASTVFSFITLKKGVLNIRNLAGQTVLKVGLEAGNQQINIENLNTGLYIVQFSDENNKVSFSKLVVK